MQNHESSADRPLVYFALVVLLSMPLWLVGGSPLPIPIDLPISSLMSLIPVIAASLLVYRQNGFSGVKDLFKKAFDARKIDKKLWYLPILLINPLIFLLSYAILRWAGQPLPEPQTPLLLAPVFFAVFFITAATEELGWMGYAFEPMQKRWGALKAALVLGIVWQLWHIIPDIQFQQAVSWILWHRLGSVALRVLIVWLYNNSGKSVFSAILCHTMNNVSWSMFPNYGSHYNPFVTGILMGLAAIIVVIGWGSKTLAGFRRENALH